MKTNYYSLSGALFITLVIIGLLTAELALAQDWYDADWQYRREVSVDNPGATVLTDFQVQITLDGTFDYSKANADGSDIRITDADGLTLIPFWIENWDDVGTQASIWVNVPNIPAIGTIIFLYYGNSLATGLSDGFTTFDFFDDFSHLQGNWIRSLTWANPGWSGYTAHDWKYSMIMQENALNYAMIRADNSWTIESLDSEIEKEFNYMHGKINTNGSVVGSAGQYEYGVILSALALGYLHFDGTNSTHAQQCYDDLVKVYGYVKSGWQTPGAANNYSMTLRGFANAWKAFNNYGNTISAAEAYTIVENYATVFTTDQSVSGHWSSPGVSVQTQLKRNFAMMLSYDVTNNASYLDAVKDNIDWIMANRWIYSNGGIRWSSSSGTEFYECHQIWYMIAVRMLYDRSGGSYDYLNYGQEAWYFLTDNSYANIDMYVHNYDNHDAFFSYRQVFGNGTYQSDNFKGSYEIGVALWGMALNYNWLSNYQSTYSSQAYNYLDELVKQIKKSPADHGYLDESVSALDASIWTIVGSPSIAIVEDDNNRVLSLRSSETHNSLVTSVDQSFDDFIFESKVKMTVDDNDLCNPQIDFRYNDLDNRYLTMMRGEGPVTNDLFFRRYQGGSTFINTGYTYDYIADQYYKYRITAHGEQIILDLDDYILTNYNDAGTNILSGGISLHNYRSNEPAYFDDVRVRKFTDSEPSTSVGDQESLNNNIDIAIYNTTCGDFEVKLKPNSDITNTLTNIQFTVKWPENTVNLTDFNSTFGVALQGSVVVDAGMNYTVFVSSASIPIDWTAGTEYTVLSFSHDHSTSGYANFEIDEGSWATANNGAYYVELLGLDFTGTVYHNALNVYLGMCGNIQVLLQGPYKGGGLMTKDLAGNIPLVQPYGGLPWNYPGTEELLKIDTNAVDWVLLELRSDTITTTERKAALLLEDGSIVQYNNTSQGVHFDSTDYGSSYFIVVYHRNHMPVMTLASTLFDGTLVDFTDETICYGTPNAEIELETGVYGMIAGDINSNGYLSYSGPGNDRGMILAKIVFEENTNDINDTTIGYFDEDVLMDYQVKYIGANNDRSIILTNLGLLTGTNYLNAIYQTPVPAVSTKSEPTDDGPIHIFLAESENELQVKIVSDETIENGIVDNMQFTLAWELSANEIIVPLLENAQSTFGLLPQGEAIYFEGKMHQVFVSVVPVELPNPFDKNEELVLASFAKDKQVTIGSSIRIANDVYTNNYNGDYFISLLGTNFTGAIKNSTLGLTDLANPGVSIYPNPVTSGMVHVDMNLEKAQFITISVMDIQGKLITSQKIKVNKGISNTKIDLQNLNKGIYYIKLQSENLHTIKKIIKI